VAEAFWKDAIFDVLDLLKFDPFKDKIGVSTVTNGTLLNEKTLLRFLERCPRAHLSFSVDAGSPETYRRIRRLDAYPLVVKNIMRVSRLRKAFPCVVLRIQNNINTLNVHEIEEMVRVAARAEANEIEFQPTGGHPQDILVNAENYRLFSNAQALAYAVGKRLGVQVRFLRPLDMGFSAAEQQQAQQIASGNEPGGLRPSISSAGEARGSVDEAAVDTLIGIVSRYMADSGITEGDDVPIREAALAIARTIGGGRAWHRPSPPPARASCASSGSFSTTAPTSTGTSLSSRRRDLNQAPLRCGRHRQQSRADADAARRRDLAFDLKIGERRELVCRGVMPSGMLRHPVLVSPDQL
jgi:hypothetical protein